MAPEILRGEQYDYNSDIYSFGLILWYKKKKLIFLLKFCIPIKKYNLNIKNREIVTGKIPHEGLTFI